jgi:hypothetical protein
MSHFCPTVVATNRGFVVIYRLLPSYFTAKGKNAGRFTACGFMMCVDERCRPFMQVSSTDGQSQCIKIEWSILHDTALCTCICTGLRVPSP